MRAAGADPAAEAAVVDVDAAEAVVAADAVAVVVDAAVAAVVAATGSEFRLHANSDVKTPLRIKCVQPRRYGATHFSLLRKLAWPACMLLLLCPSVAPQNTPEKPIQVLARGTLLRAAAIGGETTGWILQLDLPVHVKDKELNDIEVEGKPLEQGKNENKYVEAMGAIEFRSGVERSSRPVLILRSLRQPSLDGRAALEFENVRMSLEVNPVQIFWKKILGRSKPEYPGMALNVASDVRTVVKFQTAAHVCYAIRNVETRELTWKHPAQPNLQPSEMTIERGNAFLRLAGMPQEAAPSPGTYALQISLCGHDEYSLSTRFIVRAD